MDNEDGDVARTCPSGTIEIVGTVFQAWFQSCDGDTGTGTETGTDGPYTKWLNRGFDGCALPPRLLWIIQRCKRSPLREAMAQVFKKLLQTPSPSCPSRTHENCDAATFWKGHKDSLALIDTLLEYVWEHFNSGHWKDTPLYWRQIYSWLSGTKIMLVSIDPSVSPAEIIKLCDTALLVGTAQPFLANIFSKIAERLNHMLCATTAVTSYENKLEVDKSFDENTERRNCAFLSVPQRSGAEIEIPREHLPSLEHFATNYFQKRLPVLIQGGLQTWPAFGKWSPQHIANVAGSRTVPVEIGSNYIAKDWTQKLMTIRDFVNTYMLSSEPSKDVGYLAQHQLLDQVPELRNDIEIPEYCLVGEKEDVEINSWFGPAGTVTPTHFDAKHNILTQVFGSKLIIMFPPSESKLLYPHSEGSILFNTSQVNIEDPSDYEAFPEALKASYYVVFLHAGNMLYMPPNYWHFVRSLTPSFSLSFWFE